MRMQLNDVVQEFIVSNGRIAHSYFSLSEKIIESLCESNIAKEAILLRVLEQAESVTAHYFNAHQQVLEGVYAHGIAAPGSQNIAVLEPVHSNPTILAPVPAAETVEQATALSYGQWLRSEISTVTGFQAQQIDFDQSFESLGIDSLGLVDIFESLAQHFPEKKALTSQLFDAPTPTALLARLEADPQASASDVQGWVLDQLAAITGFTVEQIDPTHSYENLGLDSLVQLDFLESVVAQWPQLKAHSSELANAKFPQATIALIQATLADPQPQAAPSPAAAATQGQEENLLLNALSPLIPDAAQAIDIQTPFAQLGLNGFAREALCQSMAQQCPASEFAGEALMSRRTPQDALSLLARLS
ncbi:Phosphopantetheine attachment site [Pseudomonas sp. NFACC15-1]|uniref:phosphopantetheine-binding protein n=1 Tax=unclassified Pseudomonas TaxID=196821 RepID=UPI000884CB6E|nr:MULTISPECIES: phosphopantetheine-binding protein [unclassified Pseudomonas]SDA89782.1 Phosphopantetheine attachment site [Pseudomonas sp. NFACC15-1]SDB11111.1 Phosphopantetheine attachment site [Pseudomonas sp. NFACC13-1]SDW10407.1 Phosphopantetheine attachment site [Pseudomonas sp. NFACC14]